MEGGGSDDAAVADAGAKRPRAVEQAGVGSGALASVGPQLQLLPARERVSTDPDLLEEILVWASKDKDDSSAHALVSRFWKDAARGPSIWAGVKMACPCADDDPQDPFAFMYYGRAIALTPVKYYYTLWEDIRLYFEIWDMYGSGACLVNACGDAIVGGGANVSGPSVNSIICSTAFRPPSLTVQKKGTSLPPGCWIYSITENMT